MVIYIFCYFCDSTEPLWLMYSVIFPFCKWWVSLGPGVFTGLVSIVVISIWNNWTLRLYLKPCSVFSVWTGFVFYLYSCFRLLSVAFCVSIGLLKPILKLFLFVVICLYFCLVDSLLVIFVITIPRSQIWGHALGGPQPCWMRAFY